MKDKKTILKIGKYIFALMGILIILFFIILALGAEDIKIGGNCGSHYKSDNIYNPEHCLLCLGKRAIEREDDGATYYKCIGIQFTQQYE